MQLIGPATPGFLTTLTATILLGVVSFCVPYVKSVFFLEAAFEIGGQNGTITFGTLGYCLNLNSVTNCSSPRVGYELDINSLIDNETPISIPQVAVKWLTYALVLHIVAFVLAGASTVFGLLAHVCQIVGTCCSTCVSGFSATVALLAFIFDIALFTIAKKRINAVNGSATTGNAMWLTLAAFLLLVFTGCFYAFGSCCVPSGGGGSHGRRRSRREKERDRDIEVGYRNSLNRKSEDLKMDQIRMQAVRAEADRQAAQADREHQQQHQEYPGGYTPSQPITKTGPYETPYATTSGFIGQHNNNGGSQHYQEPYSDDPSRHYGHAADYYNSTTTSATAYGASPYSAPVPAPAPAPGPVGYDGPPGYDGHSYAGGYRKIES
ncbi:pali-domain-containing protein [Dendrothele bispora CBS 962.96]|uniref:Pali-domain-containing protein n=1 Tax=Dendrothele bispora (strain CBS 962.96) TaxID=1314807 RepID=A0A4S8KN73_DENBC|nr:pali-domain-containing protein [Dendrothele bispora CBS 962.96]